MNAAQPRPDLITRFLLAIGHELGAAQAAIKGPLSTLIDFRHELPDDEVDGTLQSIDAQTDRLAARLDELIDLARLQLGRLPRHCQPVPLAAIIEAALDALDAANRERVMLADAQPSAIVKVDEARVRRVLIDLLEAAVARAPVETPIHLTTTVSEPDWLTLSLSDLADRQSSLNEAVAILDQPDRLDQFTAGPLRRQAPLALKLTLGRALIEQQGGQLWIAPNTGPQGNTICLTCRWRRRPVLRRSRGPHPRD